MENDEILARLCSLFANAVVLINEGSRSSEEIDRLLDALQKFKDKNKR
jgi:hypothetical protein